MKLSTPHLQADGSYLILLAAMAESERSLISERTRAGMAAAHARGKHRRQPALTIQQRDEARREIDKPGADINEIAKRYRVHPRTLLRVVRYEKHTA